MVVPLSVVLTPRQADVLTGLSLGLSNAEIGRRLYLTEDTVKSHAKRLFDRLGVHDRAGAVAVAMCGRCTVVVNVRRAA